MRLGAPVYLQCASLLMCGTIALAAQGLPPANKSSVARPMNDFRPVSGNTMHAVLVDDWTEGPFTRASDERVRTHLASPMAGVANAHRRSAAKGAILGGLIGAAAGAVFGSIAPKSCCVPFGWSRGQAVALWTAGGAGAGAVIGLVVSSGSGDKAASAAVGMGRPARTLLGVRIPVGYLSSVPR